MDTAAKIVIALLAGGAFTVLGVKFYNRMVALIVSLAIALTGSLGIWIFGDDIIGKICESIDVTTPVTNTVTSMPEYEGVESADFYVSPDGDDANDGSLEKPFATIEKARDAVRALDKTGKSEVVVGIMAGDYRTTGISFTAEDSGTEDCPIRYCKYGEGEVVINGGVALNSTDFTHVTDEAMLNRLSDDAKKNVLQLDLSKYGITAEDYGKIYTIGTTGSGAYYDGDWSGGPVWSEVFFNNVRMDLARYPDEDDGFLSVDEIVEEGDNRYNPDSVFSSDPPSNPKPYVYRVDQELADRINSWKTFDDVWVFGWWKVDWADSTSPFDEFNYEERTFSPKFTSWHGSKLEAPYYFFNVFEELTIPGETYLDRENAVLYIYPTADMATATIDMSLTTNVMITVTDANYISFEGLTIKNTRGNAMSISGNGIEVTHCLITNVAGWAMTADGYDNSINYNEITSTGRGGINLTGGDRETLTPGNNRIENNLIHDWSEIYRTYQSGVAIGGVGNICAHNEMYNSSHQAITWGGNNNIIEYNIIHDVSLLSNDGGAIYGGRTWTAYGNVIRYNYIYDIGGTVKNGDKEVTYTPDGIYFDDNMAGQTAYGNILVNMPKYGILIGGGRDTTVTNNIIINADNGIYYDNRARDGSLNDGWFTGHFEGGDLITDLLASPWQTEIWQEAFPQYKSYCLDYSDIDNPGLPFNPSNSVVSENIIVDYGKKSIGDIADDIYKFSGDGIKNNLLLTKLEMNSIFTDPANGDYSIKDIEALREQVPGFQEIPMDKIGIEIK